MQSMYPSKMNSSQKDIRLPKYERGLFSKKGGREGGGYRCNGQQIDLKWSTNLVLTITVSKLIEKAVCDQLIFSYLCYKNFLLSEWQLVSENPNHQNVWYYSHIMAFMDECVFTPAKFRRENVMILSVRLSSTYYDIIVLILFQKLYLISAKRSGSCVD